MGGLPLVAVGGGYAGYWYAAPYFVGGPGYDAPYYPAMAAMGPAGLVSSIGPPVPMRGPLLPPPPPEAVAKWKGGAAKPAATANDPKRAAQLLTFGDRLFRAGNLKKAEERYLQARNAASNQAAPHFRLAQIALTRGNYTEAADRLRDAETAEPGWVLTAPDVQSLYGEPAEFARQTARLESYVQAHPDDRNAWLVLGAQWFLSGRTTRAADVFLRLNDPTRKPDVALAAFLIAVNHAGPSRENGAEPTR
jgi:tetratricopeptide (TPR) repeat protein